ncbi:MAG: glycosyltransferase family 2 protein, partial [Gemmatimonadaceae bacterium]
MSLWPLLAALPWMVIPAVVLWRARESRSLDDESPDPPACGPLVSVIIPARDEARSIERCARSVLESDYSPLEVVIVDDHSDDGTGDIARRLAREDSRLRVIAAAPLPDGWFGKQWACSCGAALARGAILCFTDADTVHAPDLLPRSVGALQARGAALLSVFGEQELGSFWERVVQPQVFYLLAARYGGAERVNRSPRVTEKIANGQFILVRRDIYESLGGHASVRDKVAEDLALAQRFFAAGGQPVLVAGARQLSTRMYCSLGEIVRGWMKNVFAGSADAVPFGAAGRALLPLALLSAPIATLAPPAVLLLSAI